MESATKGSTAIAEPTEEKRPMGRAPVHHDDLGRIQVQPETGPTGAVSPSEAAPYLSLHIFPDGKVQIETGGMSISLDPRAAASPGRAITPTGIHPVAKCS